MTRATICHCGHDKATHFEQEHTCLGMLCDCPSYADREVPRPKAKPVIAYPVIDLLPDDFDPCPDTPRMAHPAGCICAICLYWFGTPTP